MKAFDKHLLANMYLLQALERPESEKRGMPLTWTIAFQMVAQSGSEGILLTELTEKLGLSLQITARIVRMLTLERLPEGGTEGIDIFYDRLDSHKKHRKRVFLTKNGQRIVEEVQRILA